LVYTILALLIIVVIIALIYGYSPFGKIKGKTVEILPKADVPEVNEKGVSVTKPEQKPVPQLEPKPVLEPNLPKVAVELAVEPNPEATKLIDQAMALLSEKPGRIIEARDRLNETLRMPMSGRQRTFVKDQLSGLAKEWLFSRKFFPQDKLCESLQVKPGDQLRIIGERYKVPYEILMEINGISRPEALKAGEVIKVINGPFHVKIYRSTFMMDLYLQTTYVRSFRVGLGKPDRQTPTGLWRVKPGGKLHSPLWTDPDTNEVVHPESPNYPLGSRWIELEGVEEGTEGRTGFGIHGTKESETIGSADSRGCIRLDNGDVILLYNLLVPIHSLVRIED
jgi:LysM repeat protein